MKLIKGLSIVLMAVLLASCGSNKQPNVIFVLCDDLGWKDLVCYGSDLYETPNIDALAASGMLFTDAYTASPLCSPTRASVLTGQEPGRLRFTTPSGHSPQVVLDPRETTTSHPYSKTATPQTRTRLPNEYITFAEVLKEQGYSTAFMGKWHLGRDPYIPENQGFDVVVGGREHPGPPPPGRFFAPWDIETIPVYPEGTHICDVVTDKAVEYIEANQDNPFLLCLWYYDVHAPYQSKEDLKAYYAEKIGPDHIQRCPTMGGMIGNLDIQFGRVLQAVKDLKLEKETIIIFTSDNGGNMYDGPDGTTPTNNYPLRTGKGSNYEGGVRVPMIVRVPGVTKAGSVSNVVTSSVDHFISLMELLGIPYPEGQITDGESYVRALKGESYERGPMYSTFSHNTPATGNRANISMRQGPWRFYKFYYDGPDREHRYELYNLEEDISELNDLADEMPDRVEKMKQMMEAHIEEAGILQAQKNENYQGNVVDAFLGSQDVTLDVSDKVLTINSTGNEPWIRTWFTPNVNGETFLLEFEMKSDSKGEGSLQWTYSRENDFREESITRFGVKHDGDWHGYKVEMPLEDIALSTWRLAPSTAPGEVQIKNIKLTTADGYYIRDWPMYE